MAKWRIHRRRKLPVIVIVDAEADPEYGFEGLANLTRKARLDFGAEISFFDRKGLEQTFDLSDQTAIGTLEDRNGIVLAARDGYADVVQALLRQGTEVDARDAGGVTALIGAASGGQDAIIQFLLEAGADVDATDERGKTALMEASLIGHVPSVQTLLAAGADLDARDADGRTAWTYAAMARHRNVVRLFQERREPR